MHNVATLPLLLKQLELPSMYSHWEEYAETAQNQNWTYPQYLKALSVKGKIISIVKAHENSIAEMKA